jgi:hypothetical protein
MNKDRTLKKYSTPNQMEQEVLEDRNCDERMVLIRYENIRGQELEEIRPQQRRMGKAS